MRKNKITYDQYLHQIIRKLFLVNVLFFIFSIVKAQKTISSKEEIKITSSFKPTIIKKPRLNFVAILPSRDTTSFSFDYDSPDSKIRSILRSFTIKPLDLERDDLWKDSSGVYTKLGYGSLQNRLGQFGFQSHRSNDVFSLWASHHFTKGQLVDQQSSNSSIGANYLHRITDGQSINFNIGYDLDAYRQYGFDHSLYSFTKEQLNQRYNYFHSSLSFSSFLGRNQQTLISPFIHFSNLSTSKKSVENEFAFAFSVKQNLTDKISFSTKPKIDLVNYGRSKDSTYLNTLIQLPLKASLKLNSVVADAGFNTVISKASTSILPLLKVDFNLSSTFFAIFIDINNQVQFNSLHNLTTENPFIVAPDSISTHHQVDYGAGMKIKLDKRFMFKLGAGLTRFKNLPLYVNTGQAGKDLKVLTEQFLNAYHVKGEVIYAPSESFDLKSSFIAYDPYGMRKYEKVFGFIPLKLAGDIRWKPMDKLHIKSTIQFWKGAWAYSDTKSNHLLKNIIDVGIGLEYDYNKKWGIWLDLNNIANNKLTRWSQYESFGFNFVGGIRFNLFKQNAY
jgi:hypothetical protein